MTRGVKVGWKKVRLGEVCEKITDGSHWSPKSSANGIPMVSVKDMTDFGFNIKIAKRISIENYKKLVKNDCKPLIHDVLIAKDGSYLKHIFVWREDIDIALLSSIAILRPDLEIIYPEFLKYTLQSPDVKNMMKNYVTGAALPRIILEDFKKFEIEIPPLPIQHKIAAILSVYDDLIENNTCRIQILEEMAQTIYKEWFVKFHFPGHEKVKMVDSELGRIPEGWEVKRLSVLVDPQYGYTESASEDEVGPKYVRGTDINKTSYIQWDSVPYCPINEANHTKFKLVVGDILVIRMADPGKVGIVEKEIDAVFASYLIRLHIKSNSLSPYYLFHFLLSDRYHDYVTGASTGTTRKSASAGVITDIDIIIPANDIREQFEEEISTLRLMLNKLLDKNAILRLTLDLLLPKLISGEVDVTAIDLTMGGSEA